MKSNSRQQASQKSRRRQRRSRLQVLLIICIAAIPLLLTGHWWRDGRVVVSTENGVITSELAVPEPVVVPVAPDPPQIDLQKVKPNEVGRIPIVMYHDIGASSNYDSLGLNISRDKFKKQLQAMKDAGWYPITMRSVALGDIDVPAGKTPVVITFDDGRATTFRTLPDGRVDPNCAVAIFEEFSKRNPEFPFRATFYLIGTSVPFHQKETATWKVKYLIDRGHEIGNHSNTHRYMDQNAGGWVSAASIQREVAEAIRRIRAYDVRATMDTYCVPGGGYPKNRSLWKYLKEGSEGGTKYKNLVVLKAWGGPSRSPFHTSYDPLEIDRIGVMGSYLESQIALLKAGIELQAYISDGDPDKVTLPRSFEKYVNKAALGRRVLRVYDLPGSKSETEPSVEPATSN
jgi:peptidoglycan/xylan/chitin deacetylase (PgdA/CDA1 family)